MKCLLPERRGWNLDCLFRIRATVECCAGERTSFYCLYHESRPLSESDGLRVGRGTAKAEDAQGTPTQDAQGTPTQRHISPSIPVHEETDH